MPLALLPGGLAGWYGMAALFWAAVVALGVSRRRGAGPALPLLVGAGSGLLPLAAIGAGSGFLRLPLPWFLGAAGVVSVSRTAVTTCE